MGESGTVWLDHGRLEVNTAFLPILDLNGLTTFTALMSHPGDGVAKCVLKERYTVWLDLKQKNGTKARFFLKRYCPKRPQLLERLNACLRPRQVSSARQEWQAMWTFKELGLPGPIPVAWGQDKGNSLVLSEGIKYRMRLSDWAERYLSHGQLIAPEVVKTKHKIIEEVARIVGSMHAKGLHHQDLYLCHFLCGSEAEGLPLTLIDLQRVEQFRSLPRRWQIKDLAQLRFSSAPYITRHDIWRFWKVYSSIYKNMTRETSLWRSVLRKSRRIRHHTVKHGL